MHDVSLCYVLPHFYCSIGSWNHTCCVLPAHIGQAVNVSAVHDFVLMWTCVDIWIFTGILITHTAVHLKQEVGTPELIDWLITKKWISDKPWQTGRSQSTHDLTQAQDPKVTHNRSNHEYHLLTNSVHFESVVHLQNVSKTNSRIRILCMGPIHSKAHQTGRSSSIQGCLICIRNQLQEM